MDQTEFLITKDDFSVISRALRKSLEEDEFPIEPSAQMAVQLSVDEPPVDDPEFIPATVQELCLAACRIAKEVPSEKIEFFNL